MIEWIKKNIVKIVRIIVFVLVVAILFKQYTRVDNVLPSENAISEYMLNTSSMKIHIPTCASVAKMSEKNKKLVNANVLDLVADGYTICFNCYAGLKRRSVVETILDSTIFRNITEEKPTDLPTVEEYLNAVDTMCRWYTEHIPTYLTELQSESIDDYNKLIPYIHDEKYKGDYLMEYHLYNKYKSKIEKVGTYNVITSDNTNSTIDTFDKGTNILKANEMAVKYYHDNYDKIKFRKSFAYYPCELISNSEDDYNMAGDDCVRLIFSALNYMDNGFTKKLKKYSKLNWSRITSTKIAKQDLNIAYAMETLGFEIYDSEEMPQDLNKDNINDLIIYPLESEFKLKKGDIIVRPKHVHFYLGDGKSINVENFGWGKVNRCFPQISNIYVEGNIIKFVNIVTGRSEHYTRVYRYVGKED